MTQNKGSVREIPFLLLTADPENVRIHTKPNSDAIRKSLEDSGQVYPLVVAHERCFSDKDWGEKYVILSGNETAVQMKALGYKEATCQEVEGSADDCRSLAIALNRTGELSFFDEKKMAMMMRDMQSRSKDPLVMPGFSNLMIRELTARLPGPSKLAPVEESPDPDSVQTPKELRASLKWDGFNPWGVMDTLAPDEWVKPGDTFMLGDHRLHCGDATDPEAVASLMRGDKANLVFTDPPYGTDAKPTMGYVKKREGVDKIENDKLSGDALTRLYEVALRIMPVTNDCSYYVCFHWKAAAEVYQAIENLRKDKICFIKNVIVWNKTRTGLGNLNQKCFYTQYENIAFMVRKDRGNAWYGNPIESDVWNYRKTNDTESRGASAHATPKPIDMIGQSMRVSSKTGDIVADMFAGSGTTLMAAEKWGRVARLMELDPRHCTAIKIRWEAITGLEGVRL